MKTQLIAGLILAGFAFSASAEEEAQLATGAEFGALTPSMSAESEPSHASFSAGSQMLIEISAKVSGDLDQQLEREVGGEVTVQLRQRELLVSSN